MVTSFECSHAKACTSNLGPGMQTPASAKNLTEEIQALRKENLELKKDNRRLKEENEFLAEASAFFAASRWKSAKS